VFEMSDAGLREVRNPSALFLGEGGERAAGSVVFAGVEGSRPVLVEFQALVAPSAYGTPRRAVVGWDSGRLAMVLAVLEARWGFGRALAASSAVDGAAIKVVGVSRLADAVARIGEGGLA